jgi:hypothetical protein
MTRLLRQDSRNNDKTFMSRLYQHCQDSPVKTLLTMKRIKHLDSTNIIYKYCPDLPIKTCLLKTCLSRLYKKRQNFYVKTLLTLSTSTVKTESTKSGDSEFPQNFPPMSGTLFLAALSSSRSLVVGRSVRRSVRPSVIFVKKWPLEYQMSDWVTEWLSDWVTEWLSDWVTEWLTEWLSD